ncbi:MAG: TetR-like C-terminal domain-containing protein [Beduini sp.]|uniref:TetR-like C-terminal domain-containing protein n=1 Tax=Beduini sp. TaxID=1922300 RepID=UPI00399F1647
MFHPSLITLIYTYPSSYCFHHNIKKVESHSFSLIRKRRFPSRSALRRAIIEHFCFILENEQIFKDYENEDIMIPYITYGLIGIVNKWLNTKKESPEEMTEITLDFFNGQFHKKEKG